MIDSFPVFSDNRKLLGEDFSIFSTSYSNILKKHLPTASQVAFFHKADQAAAYFQDNVYQPELVAIFRQIQEGGSPCVIHAECLMLSFAIEDGKTMVAIVRGADPVFLRKVREDWLLETCGSIEREFLLLKQARVDVQTGLLNLSNLYYLLDTHGGKKGFQLILLELPSRRSSLGYALRHAKKCASALLSFIKGDSVLHYLGQCTFALVLQNIDEGQETEIESALVSYLKREGCHRVHIGSSCSSDMNGNDYKDSFENNLLDKAWTALRHAVKRGPFGFCAYSLLAHPERHSLAPSDKNLVRRLNRMAARSELFSLVRFRGESESTPASGLLVSLVDRGVTVSDGDDVLVYLDGVDGKKAVKWAREIIARIKNPQKNIHISAGISCYPFGDFNKSEMDFNCRKALLHAAFFGKSSVTLFDGVSLNISGDIYYGDGDLVKAVKEYKRGLQCDGGDVNLHNSLGVALVMMNKLSPAIQSFKSGLEIDKNNFMALYNLGLAEQTRNRNPEAFSYLEKALACYSQEEGGAELLADLKLQIGILSSEIGRYDLVLGYLGPWLQDNLKKQGGGRIYYYLGEAYHGLQDNQKAMEYLQRALRFDEFDDRAMNLLGRVYLEEGEGDEIALSLCRKSVELEPSNIRYRLYLAEVLVRCGIFQEAKDKLYSCLKNRSCKMEAQLLLGKSYMQEGQYRRAGNWFEKVLAGDKGRKNLRREAKAGVAEIKERLSGK